MAKAENEIANSLKLLAMHNRPYTLEEYPIPAEDWEVKQGEGVTVIRAWKAVLNYDNHDVSIRYADANTGMVIAWNFKNCEDWDDVFYNIDKKEYDE